MEQPVFIASESKIPKTAKLIDAYKGADKELFFIRNPKIKKNFPDIQNLLKDFCKKNKLKQVWIYFPWKNVAVKTVPEQVYFELRTSRNKNIISAREQLSYRKLSVGIAGLSVGSCILNAIAISGGPKKIKIADFDTLEITNLNRIRANLTEIGQNKTHIAAQGVWEIDPFAELKLFDKGLDEKNISSFLLNKPKLDVFIDEMDNIDLKIKARLICRDNKIPVLMATDNGDGILLDVERFDLEPKRKIFHGLLGKIENLQFKNFSYQQWLSLATKIVGPEYLTMRMQESILQIGGSLPAVPQLGTSANIAGAAVSLALRRISNKQPMPSGRYIISLEEKLVPAYMSKANINSRQEKTKKFKKLFS